MIKELIQKIRGAKEKASITPAMVAEVFDAIHDERKNIVLRIRDNILYLPGADKMVEEGYVPFIFRYNLRRSTKMEIEADCTIKRAYRITKGWNLYSDAQRVSFKEDRVLFYERFNPSLHLDWSPYPDALFLPPHIEVQDGIAYVRIPFGGNCKKLTKERPFCRCRFGIAFARPGYKKIVGTPFDFSALVTNIVPFDVLLHREDKNLDIPEISYHFAR